MTATTEQAHMQATLAEMKQYNVVKAVVSNDYQVALRWKAASPDHIIPSYGFKDIAQSIDPNLSHSQTEKFRNDVIDDSIRLTGCAARFSECVESFSAIKLRQ
jgi:hypothetical protein